MPIHLIEEALNSTSKISIGVYFNPNLTLTQIENVLNSENSIIQKLAAKHKNITGELKMLAKLKGIL